MTNVLISGVGGQGTVLASKLIAAAAMAKELDVRTTETIGMAQRGGSVVSHVRIGQNINSPLIPQRAAHAVIGFEPAEAVRVLPYLSADGLMIVCDKAMKPVTSSLKGDTYKVYEMIDYLKKHVKKLVVIDGEKLMSECINAKTLNVALLGAASESGVFPFNVDEMKDALRDTLPQRYLDINLNSFEIGRRMYNETRNAG
ncbi:MAG: indolepyruvate oxidoreductase subunit beta [Acetivibrionales bacterium]|jgi:indolepyruvate ferredoxin oxidoreductase beta subunit|nr:indolepyruvate oxidoreductase subunit beta [Clostridiaceae bacterium]